jgi:hypothetical protein
MSLLMVYGMETYNAMIRAHGLSLSTLVVPIPELLLLSLIVYILQALLANPFSSFVNKMLWGGPSASPLYRGFTFPIFILIIMCPAMSLVATLLFQYDRDRVLGIWGQTILRNLPMALVWQLLIVGPGLRRFFGMIHASEGSGRGEDARR